MIVHIANRMFTIDISIVFLPSVFISRLFYLYIYFSLSEALSFILFNLDVDVCKHLAFTALIPNESSVGIVCIEYAWNSGIFSPHVRLLDSRFITTSYFLPQVFHEMVSAGVEPNVHTYGALIDGCGRAGEVAKAFGAYGIMRSKVLLH